MNEQQILVEDLKTKSRNDHKLKNTGLEQKTPTNGGKSYTPLKNA